MNHESGRVYVVDDEAAMQKALARLLRSAGFAVSTFSSATDFLAAYRDEEPACLVLDVEMPELNGLELQRRLAETGTPLPILFLSGHGDIPMTVHAIRAGAVDFLTKPVNDLELLGAIRAALHQAIVARAEHTLTSALVARFGRLTPREREVMAHVVAGQLNKQIAADLGIVEKTIKVHRARVMEKMGVQSVADLVRAAERLGFGSASAERVPDA